MRTNSRFGLGIATLVSLIFCIGGFLFTANAMSFKDNAIKIDATIVEIVTTGSGDDRSSTAIVGYKYNGKEYTCALHEYSSSMYKGKSQPIYIDPEQPEKAVIPGIRIILGLCFSFFGGIFVIAAIVQFVRNN